MACSFQGVSLCYSFFCLLVSSVSGFRPDTKGTVEDPIFFFFFFNLGSLVQPRCGEGGRNAANVTLACLAVPQPHWVCPRSARVASLPTLLGL